MNLIEHTHLYNVTLFHSLHYDATNDDDAIDKMVAMGIKLLLFGHFISFVYLIRLFLYFSRSNRSRDSVARMLFHNFHFYSRNSVINIKI